MDGIISIIILGGIIWVFIQWASYIDNKRIETRNQVLKDFEKQFNLQAIIDDIKKSLASKNYKEIEQANEEPENCISPSLVGSFNNFLSNCVCPSCGEGHPRERIGRYGEFIGCSNYPSCTYTEKVKSQKLEYKAVVKKQIPPLNFEMHH